MDLRLADWDIPSDLVAQLLNPFFVLMFAPLMDYLLYPLLAKKNILVK